MFIAIIILGYVILASMTSLFLKINDVGFDDFNRVMLGILFPFTWFYFLIKLPIIIYNYINHH